jgi:hypothetical protein
MLRAVLVLAGTSALLAPTLAAQNPLLCVFQQKQGHAEDAAAGTDATALAKELVARTTAAGTALDIMPFLASAPKKSMLRPSIATVPGSLPSGARRSAPTPRTTGALWEARRPARARGPT